MEMLFEGVVVFLLVLANGVFALAEIAVVSSRRVRLEAAAAGGDAAAHRVLSLQQSPERFLSTVQVGITLIGVVAGAYGGATLSEELTAAFSAVAFLRPYAGSLAFGLVVALITFLSVVVGELVPKRLALTNPEGFAKWLAAPMNGLSRVSAPLIWLLSASASFVLRLLRVKPADEPALTEEEIKLILDQGASAGVLEQTERSVVERVLHFTDRRAASLMTPRPEVVWLDVNAPLAESLERMSREPHSYFPVCDGDLDRVLGIIGVKELWRRMVAAGGRPLDLRAALQPPTHVPEGAAAFQVLEALRSNRRHFALVLDEYGTLTGVITLHDLTEALVGELPQAGDDPSDWAVPRADGSWLLDGLLPLDEMHRLLPLPDAATDVERRYHTVAGLLLAELGHLPKIGEAIEWGGFRFEVIDLDGFRIDRVLATPLPPPTPAPPAE